VKTTRFSVAVDLDMAALRRGAELQGVSLQQIVRSTLTTIGDRLGDGPRWIDGVVFIRVQEGQPSSRPRRLP